MIAPTQYQLLHQDLQLILALVRGRSLARAAELMQVDVSTVFRAIRKLETALGSALFDKGRSGYLPTSAALALAEQAERAEQALDAARLAMRQGTEVISGTVRLTCTEAVLHSLLLPALAQFMPHYPALSLELATSNSFANLSRRDADVALRLTNEPPQHLTGRCLGLMQYVVCGQPQFAEDFARAPASLPWIAPDDAMPDHVTVAWRKQEYPDVLPRYRCSGMATVGKLVQAGLGVAAITRDMAASLELPVLSSTLAGCDTQLWILTRPDCRHLKAVQLLFDELSPRLRDALTPASRTATGQAGDTMAQ